jgi:hypothetical protein
MSSDAVTECFALFDKSREFVSGSNGPRLAWTLNASEYLDGTKDRLMAFQYKHLLSVNCEAAKIREIYAKHEVVRLREYAGERTLVVGCGNSPFLFGASLGDKTQPTFCMSSHEGCYTVNVDLGMNPSVVMEFGEQDFVHLPSFDKVVFENMRWSTEPKRWKETLLHVLHDEAYVQFRPGGKTVYKKGGALFCESEYINDFAKLTKVADW